MTDRDTLLQRNIRRRKNTDNILVNCSRFVRILPYLWKERHKASLRPFFEGTTFRLSKRRRLRLCVFTNAWKFIKSVFSTTERIDGTRLRFPLATRPWWPSDDFSRLLETNIEGIRSEFLRLELQLRDHPNTSSLVASGKWSIIPLFKGGRKCKDCTAAPRTVGLIESSRHCCLGGDGIGQAVFSVLTPGTCIKEHQGSVNLRIRYHLCLEVEDGAEVDTLGMRVAGAARTWKKGECVAFDDSFMHSVWHHGQSRRVVLMVDLWHPDLSNEERDFAIVVSEVLLGA